MESDPDGMQRLWAPDRLAYILGENRPDSTDAGDACPFCRAPAEPDDESLVVARGAARLRRAEPLPVQPRPRPDLHLPARRRVRRSDAATRRTRSPTSPSRPSPPCSGACCRTASTSGMNQGTVGGAGIAAHLHQHVVPRWGGDTNFMPVVARPRSCRSRCTDTRDALRAAWPDG